MDQQTASAALQFINRIQLAPSEINAFIAVNNALSAIANPETAIDKQADKEASGDNKSARKAG